MQMKRSVQTPVSLVRSLSGLALRFPVRPAQTSQATGPRLATKTSGLTTKRMVFSDTCSVSVPCGLEAARAEARNLVVLFQIESRVETLDLLGVAVEHQRLALEELADAAFARLAPARVIDVRIDVRVEAVFLRRRVLPGVERLPLGEPDPDDRLRPLEA